MSNQILVIPIRDCTSDNLIALGKEGFRIIAANGDSVIFGPGIKLESRPPEEVKKDADQPNPKTLA